MVQALQRLRNHGLTVAALTNNFDTEPDGDGAVQARADQEHMRFVALFDHFIESRVVGMSKPDPRWV
jgi:FMN phosphatase YigB (HAD superfamily)